MWTDKSLSLQLALADFKNIYHKLLFLSEQCYNSEDMIT